MSINTIKARSAVHTATINALELSYDGRKIADDMCRGVAALIERSIAVKTVRGEDVALDYFYDGLVDVYATSGWGRMGWRDKLAMSKTATLADMGSIRALRASLKISLL